MTHRLHAQLVTAQGASPNRAMLFLHGILGSGPNLRSLAQRVLATRSELAAVLVDLRGHGRSHQGDPPHTLEACAEDVADLAAGLDWPVETIVGHSFGGKVALAYSLKAPELRRVVLLDSAPGARPDRTGSEDTMEVLAALRDLRGPFSTREAFTSQLTARGFSASLAQWLAMNLRRSATGFVLSTDLDQIDAMLADYFARDLWPALEDPARAATMVIGGRSTVWDAAQRERARGLADAHSGRVRVEVLEQAGHWVHVEDPAAVATLVSDAAGGRTHASPQR